MAQKDTIFTVQARKLMARAFLFTLNEHGSFVDHQGRVLTDSNMFQIILATAGSNEINHAFLMRLVKCFQTPAGKSTPKDILQENVDQISDQIGQKMRSLGSDVTNR